MEAMARRVAQITQADIARAIRAAKQAGAAAVEVHVTGQSKIIFRINPLLDEQRSMHEPVEIVL
jgi:hypothetical protein